MSWQSVVLADTTTDNPDHGLCEPGICVMLQIPGSHAASPPVARVSEKSYQIDRSVHPRS
jgi:hypothetical protein